MKRIICLLVPFLLVSCEYRQGYINGDISNFKGSEVYELARYVKNGDVDQVEILLNTKQYNINEVSPIGSSSLLSLAISKNDYNMVACLMKHGADPFLKLDHTSPLEEAIQKCHIESLNEMIKLGNFDTIPETLASSSLFKAYNSGCSQAMDILKQQGVLERENGLVVYNSLVYRIFSKPGEKVCGDPIELMDLGFAFDDSFPIRHPDLISNESHKGKTISQILREEDLLEEEELIYLKEKRGVNVSPN